MAHTGKPVAELMGRADMLKTSNKPELPMSSLASSRSKTSWLEKPAVTRARLQGRAFQRRRGRYQGPARRHGAGRHREQRLPLVLSSTWCAPGRLVHVSQLSHKFVTDAREVVKTGDIVKVRVTEVDVGANASGLTMKSRCPAGVTRRDNRFAPGRCLR
jgi:uncharacterized protein